jgi:hypothetical protein
LSGFRILRKTSVSGAIVVRSAVITLMAGPGKLLLPLRRGVCSGLPEGMREMALSTTGEG